MTVLDTLSPALSMNRITVTVIEKTDTSDLDSNRNGKIYNERATSKMLKYLMKEFLYSSNEKILNFEKTVNLQESFCVLSNSPFWKIVFLLLSKYIFNSAQIKHALFYRSNLSLIIPLSSK